jgi:S-layer homology domain.
MKKKLKSIIALLMLICVFTTSTLSAQAAPVFEDVAQGSWYYKTVYKAVEKGYFGGTSKTTFSPDATTTRAMLVTVLSNITENYSAKPHKNKTRFNDVPSSGWFSAPVEWAATYGIVNGTSDVTFSPNQPITRQDAIVLLHRYADMTGNSTSYSGNKETAFSDFSQTSGYAKKALRWAINNGIINGNEHRQVRPHAFASRAEIAKILLNADSYLHSKTIVKTPSVPTPKPNPTGVYWTPNGVVYHRIQNCVSLARSKDIRSGTIAQSGKPNPCKNCY